jgi:hypothetical protein
MGKGRGIESKQTGREFAKSRRSFDIGDDAMKRAFAPIVKHASMGEHNRHNPRDRGVKVDE